MVVSLRPRIIREARRDTKALPRDPLAELAERLRSLSEADRKRLIALLG
jgi:hypothetical protein